MERTILRTALVFGLLALLVPAAFAAPPLPGSGPPGPGSDIGTQPEQTKPPREYQGLGVGQQLTSFAGTVLDVNDHLLAGVQVKLFVDSQIVGTITTDANGFYEIKTPFNAYDDTTVLLWYVSPDRTLLPKSLVIRESKVSQENSLISKCVPRATLTPGRQFRVYVFDPANRNKDVAETNCLP